MRVAGGGEVWSDAARGQGDVKGRETAGCCGGAAPVVHCVDSEVQRVTAEKCLCREQSQLNDEVKNEIT